MKKNILLLTVLSVLFASCGVNRVYIPGSYGSGSIKSYTPRPIYKDTTVSETYISANISYGIISHLTENSIHDKKTIVNFNIHKGISTKNFNYHYGIGASYGDYTFKYPLGNLIKKNETKSFYNFTSKLGINFRKNSKNYNYEKRWLGFELIYTYETGPYQNKLSYLKEQLPASTYIIVDKKSLLTANIYWEKIFILNDDKNFGLSLYLGGILDFNKVKYHIPKSNAPTGFAGIIFNYTNKKYTFSIISERYSKDSKSINFGISYKL